MNKRVIMAIDPGDTHSAYCFLVNGEIADKGKVENEVLLKMLEIKESAKMGGVEISDAELVIEWIQGYGMTVGQSVFETCRWVGKFEHAWGRPVTLMGRKAVKSHLCNTTKAGDPHVREALIDRFGGQRGKAKQKGVLEGFSGDMWAALGVAVTFMDTRKAA
jgi:hypothetical protein